MWEYVTLSIVCVWTSFAAVIIALSNVAIQATVTRECECRLTSSTPPGSAAMVIRIVYKSAILLIAFLVVTAVMWMRPTLMSRSHELFYQILLFTSFLLLNCVTFVAYYVINQPSPYFAISLWFTELLPIVCLLCLLALPELRVWKNTTIHSIRTQVSSSSSEYSALLSGASPNRDTHSYAINE
jgi:hypothetical protein